MGKQQKQKLKKQASKLPNSPGVYFFLGRNNAILYIGKATSLSSRTKSYFSADLHETRGPLIEKMLTQARGIDFRKTDSVLEAVLLEADLIKKFQPSFNTKEKDDKSFNCVVITREDFPRVLLMRGRDLKLKTEGLKPKASYGPFPEGGMLKDAMKIIRRIFPYRDDKCRPGQGEPCFNRQIGLCPGVCTGEISKQDYAKTVRNIRLFFSGRKSRLLKDLRQEMNRLAKERNFEAAGRTKKTIFALEHIQDVALIKNSKPAVSGRPPFRIEAYDVAHIFGTNTVGVMTVIENDVPKKSDYRKFKIHREAPGDDVGNLKEVLERRLNHDEWPKPSLFVADGGLAQKNAIEEILAGRGITIPVCAVTKNERHRPEKILGDQTIIRAREKAILLANREAHRFAIAFHRQRRGSAFKFQSR